MPDKFKLVPNDDRAKKQLSAIHRLMARDDVDRSINACDAGREGELIFAYVYETAKKKKPVKRLWLSSMTKEAIEEAFTQLRRRRGDGAARGRRALALRGRLGGGHERHPRRLDPAARGLRRRRLAGPGADADAGAGRPPRGGDPRVQARALLAGRGRVRRLRASASTRAATWAASGSPRTRRPKIVEDCKGQPGTITKLEKKEETEQRPAPLRPHLAPAPRQHAATASRRAARCRRRRSSTRSTRRSPTRAPTRAS